MAAYGAATSLKNTIQRIVQSSRISLVPPSPEILQPAYEAMVRLQKVLLKLDETSCSKIRTEVNALDERIKEVIWEFEDLLESLFTDQILPQLGSPSRGERDHSSFSVDLQSLRQSVDCFVERVAVMEAEYDVELVNMPDEEGESLDSRIDCQGINSEMVGLSDEFERVRDHLLEEAEYAESDDSDESDEFDYAYVNGSLITGMAGVGKTTLAKKVFDDPSIQEHFDFRAWVKVGRKCEPIEILLCVLAQVDPETLHQMLTQGEDIEDEEFIVVWEEIFKDKKGLIVLDDVWEWDGQVIDCFQKSDRFLLTSRLGMKSYMTQEVRLLNEEESKKLLGEKVFGEEGFPPHLEKLGEKIAKKCEGLPLMIVTVAELLTKEDQTAKYWTEIAQKQYNAVFVDAYNQIEEVLFPSYNYLPQYLKMLFLYLGAFAPYCDIKVHNLFQRLSAEGFLEPSGKQTCEDSSDDSEYYFEASYGWRTIFEKLYGPMLEKAFLLVSSYSSRL